MTRLLPAPPSPPLTTATPKPHLHPYQLTKRNDGKNLGEQTNFPRPGSTFMTSPSNQSFLPPPPTRHVPASVPQPIVFRSSVWQRGKVKTVESSQCQPRRWTIEAHHKRNHHKRNHYNVSKCSSLKNKQGERRVYKAQSFTVSPNQVTREPKKPHLAASSHRLSHSHDNRMQHPPQHDHLHQKQWNFRKYRTFCQHLHQ